MSKVAVLLEPQRQEIIYRTYAPSENSDKSVRSHSLILRFTQRIWDSQGCNVNFLHADYENSDQLRERTCGI